MYTPDVSTTNTPIQSDLPRTIGFLGAIGLMVGIIIGSGIFKTPASIAQHLDGPLIVLGLWTLGGVICLCGAFTYAELATMFPQSGGIYVFLREGFGRPAAFTFGWTYMLISKPLAAAGIALVFVEHLNRLLPPDRYFDPAITTCMLLIGLTAINARGTRLGTGFGVVLTIIKVLSLCAIILLGLLFGHRGESPAIATPTQMSLLAALAPVMGSILWTYDGWSDVGAIAGEVKDPQRQLPRIFFVGTVLVTLLYVAVNAVFMWIVPLEEMRMFKDSQGSLAPLVMERAIGPSGGVVIVVMVLIATLGSTHGAILTGGRVTYAQAKDGLLFRWLAGVHPKYHTPARSLWIQCGLSCAAMIAYGTFDKLAAGFVFTMWIFYGLAGLTIFIFRIKRPTQDRPYRCWGYPVVPGLFVLAAAAMTALTLRNLAWRESVLWTGVLLAGIPVYYVWERAVKRGRSAGLTDEEFRQNTR